MSNKIISNAPRVTAGARYNELARIDLPKADDIPKAGRMGKKLWTYFVLFAILFSFSASTRLNAQYYMPQNYNWLFAMSGGVTFPGGTSPASIISSTLTYEGSASVSDPAGNLLFYSAGEAVGTKVYDKNGMVMPGGTNLTPSFGTSSTTQGAVIVPIPGSTTRYYVFSLTQIDDEYGAYCRLYSCTVDMTLPGNGTIVSPLGDVVPGTVTLPLAYNLCEKMTVVAGNNCDIWLLVHKKDAGTFLAYDITSSGIGAPVSSSPGEPATGTNAYKIGTIKVSPDRTMIANCVVNGSYGGSDDALELLQFSAATGIVSNCQVLNNYLSQYDADFSHDSKKLYSRVLGGSIFQYDLTTVDATSCWATCMPGVIASENIVATPATYGGQMRLGPDKKLYLQTSVGYLDCINKPWLSGLSCNYVANQVAISGTGVGMPNIVVSTAPAAISGPLTICQGATVTLTDLTSGGTWTSDNPLVAPVGPTTGIVTGASAGTADITYTTECGTAVAIVTVMAVPTPGEIAGPHTGCPGNIINLTNTTYTGATSTWWSFVNIFSGADEGSTDPPTGSTLNPATGQVVLGAGPATIIIKFYAASGSCPPVSTTFTITINPIPAVATAIYTGCMPPCPNTPLTFDIHGTPGATTTFWYSDPSGIPTGTIPVLLNGAGIGSAGPITPSGTPGMFNYATLGSVFGTCVNNTADEMPPLDLEWPWAKFDQQSVYGCSCVYLRIVGTPGATASVTGGSYSFDVLLDATGHGISPCLTLSGPTTFTIGNVTGPCCSHYSGSTITITPAEPAVVSCTVGEGMYGGGTYYFVTGTPAGAILHYKYFDYGCTSPTTPCCPGSYTIPLASGTTYVQWYDDPALVGPPGSCSYSSMYPWYTYGIQLNYVTTINPDRTTCDWPINCNQLFRPGHSNSTVAGTIEPGSLTVVPNPNNGTFEIKGGVPKTDSKEAQIEVVNMLGQSIITDIAAIENGGIHKTITLDDNIANGVYLVRIKADNVSQVIRFTLDR